MRPALSHCDLQSKNPEFCVVNIYNARSECGSNVLAGDCLKDRARLFTRTESITRLKCAENDAQCEIDILIDALCLSDSQGVLECKDEVRRNFLILTKEDGACAQMKTGYVNREMCLFSHSRSIAVYRKEHFEEALRICDTHAMDRLGCFLAVSNSRCNHSKCYVRSAEHFVMIDSLASYFCDAENAEHNSPSCTQALSECKGKEDYELSVCVAEKKRLFEIVETRRIVCDSEDDECLVKQIALKCGGYDNNICNDMLTKSFCESIVDEDDESDAVDFSRECSSRLRNVREKLTPVSVLPKAPYEFNEQERQLFDICYKNVVNYGIAGREVARWHAFLSSFPRPDLIKRSTYEAIAMVFSLNDGNPNGNTPLAKWARLKVTPNKANKRKKTF
eukprot:GDKK01009808.1.p1 GENE.GDKK01009808.1~~GDKK01009808.1.p1  ORF type:complete len:392 (-),score=72.16 GDKK01009808.1:76-1251(-)